MTLKVLQTQIPRRSPSCLQCQESSFRGNECHTLLSPAAAEKGESSAMQRRDFCKTCWGQQQRPLSSVEKEIYWKSNVAAKPISPTLSRDKRALQLFSDNATAEPQEISLEELYCLTLYLLRQRLIIQRQEIVENGEPLLLLEIAESSEMRCIRKIALDKLDLPTLQKSLATRLA